MGTASAVLKAAGGTSASASSAATKRATRIRIGKRLGKAAFKGGGKALARQSIGRATGRLGEKSLKRGQARVDNYWSDAFGGPQYAATKIAGFTGGDTEAMRRKIDILVEAFRGAEAEAEDLSKSAPALRAVYLEIQSARLAAEPIGKMVNLGVSLIDPDHPDHISQVSTATMEFGTAVEYAEDYATLKERNLVEMSGVMLDQMMQVYLTAQLAPLVALGPAGVAGAAVIDFGFAVRPKFMRASTYSSRIAESTDSAITRTVFGKIKSSARYKSVKNTEINIDRDYGEFYDIYRGLSGQSRSRPKRRRQYRGKDAVRSVNRRKRAAAL